MERIKAVTTYQSVIFEKKNETHFTTLPVAGKPTIELKFVKELMAIEIKSDKDHVLIPLTNIGAIYLWTKEDDKYLERKEEAKNVKTGVKAEDIKRPMK